jgi:hypothetical protein
MYSVYTYLIEELRHGNDVRGWILTFATSHLMRSMNAEAMLKHHVRNEQTSGQKNRRQKVFLFFIFFQPICKFSGRSDNLLTAGAKGLKVFTNERPHPLRGLKLLREPCFCHLNSITVSQ